MGLFDRDDFYSTKVNRRRVGGGGNAGSGSVKWLFAAALILIISAGGWIWVAADNGKDASHTKQTAIPAIAETAPQDLLSLNNQFIDIADRVQPAIVTVLSYLTDRADEYSLGSGIIIEKSEGKALLVTNQHVVEDGIEFEVVLQDGEVRSAELVGSDWMTDLAILEIDGEGIDRVAELGDSDELRKGEMAIVMGNPLGLNFSQSISVGVISSTHLTVPVVLGGQQWEMDVIQTDAAINQGNSGGALLNLQGEVVGINNMKIAEFGVEGLGFAIPINDAKPIIEQLIENGEVQRPLIGITSIELAYTEEPDAYDLPEDVDYGLVVVDVSGPAKEAGLTVDDVVVALDGVTVYTQIDLRRYLYKNKEIGDTLLIEYYRDGELYETDLTLAERDE
ncbi:S1C family serine protease [Marinicrinis lubricantis]|uniref:S1C family serine protease n=1 Tax=Marinicrinis lubricantis TaxID=2086470 RepID=A0ABW1IQW5_9BACL